jgi:DNA repair protein RecN (Recombination protein N)
MLRFMRIHDFALIHELEIEFHEGLNLLTGETGSGKSIIVDALSLITGARSSPEMIRSGCLAAVVEGEFDLEPSGRIGQALEAAGLPAGEEALLIRREIAPGGRSRVFLNDTLATVSLLRTIGKCLVDIHGQHDHQSLLDPSTHVMWIDRFGKNELLAGQVAQQYKVLREIESRLASLKMDDQERLRRLDILQFQVDEIRRANLELHEREDLQGEKVLLANREKIFSLASEAHRLMYEEEPSILGAVNRLEHILVDLAAFDTSWSSHREVLRDCIYKMEDIALGARNYVSNIDFSPDRLDQVEQRLAELDRLGRKYGNSVAGILAYADQCSQELNELQGYSDTRRGLIEQLQQESRTYMQLSEQLSQKRRKDAAGLEHEMHREFGALAMERMKLSVSFQQADSMQEGGLPTRYGSQGIDEVEFLIAPNRGEEERPLAKIASGGELSRIMLSIQSLCGAKEAEKTLVFDEIDAGIGGRVAEAVGRRLHQIASSNQVLCVTHLPQIASFAHHHYHVKKDAVGSRTETFVRHLAGGERVHELARMLGGEVITETARNHAREMFERSHKGAVNK